MDLLETSTLTITPGATGSSYNADGDWVEGTVGAEYEIKCSIQPFFPTGTERKSLPEGVEVDDIKVIYTRDERVRTGSLGGGYEPDTTVIRGQRYYAWRERDFTFIPSDIAHKQLLFVRIAEARNVS